MVTSRGDSVIAIRVPAKLNLFFEVLGKRSDGFHEIETLMAPIDLCDDLLFQVDPSGNITVECNWATANVRGGNRVLGMLPDAVDNLATRALRLLHARAGVTAGARVRIIKRIPAAAGLGGGSTDAAAALTAANLGWKLNWSFDQLAPVAAELGSDVPFFLRRTWAMCRGRGERIEPVAGLGIWHAVVVRPPAGLSTAEVYRDCVPNKTPTSAEPLMAILRRGDMRTLAGQMTNDLQQPAKNLTPWIERILHEFRRVGCEATQMSGSGTSCFGICRSRRHARRVAAQIRAREMGRVFVVQIGTEVV